MCAREVGAQTTIKFGTELPFRAESHPTSVQYIHTVIWAISNWSLNNCFNNKTEGLFFSR